MTPIHLSVEKVWLFSRTANLAYASKWMILISVHTETEVAHQTVYLTGHSILTPG